MTGTADRAAGTAGHAAPPSRCPRSLIGLAAAALAGVLTGCATPAQPAPSGPQLELVAAEQVRVDPARIAKVADSAALTLPADRYLWTEPETERVRRADETLQARCLARFGLALPSTAALPNLAPESPTARRYGLTSTAEAARTGYRLPAALAASSRPQPSLAQPDPDVLAVLQGSTGEVDGKPVPDGGCQAEAERRLGAGTQVGIADLAQDLNGKSWELAKAHPLVTQAFAKWSKCMEKAGFAYPDPMAAMNDDRFTGAPTAVEIATAEQDVACKRANNTAGVWYSVEVEVQRVLIDHNKPALEEVRQAKTDQLARADAVLARR